MNLTIQLKKGRDKQSVITCIREDGTSCWARLPRALEDHDLAHFVVESTLGYKNAFFGMIDRGFSITDFELPRDKRPAALMAANLHPEAINAEYIVNQLQTEYWNDGSQTDFVLILAKTMQDKTLAFPEDLDQRKVDLIREQYQQLVCKWKTMPPDQILELIFQIA